MLLSPAFTCPPEIPLFPLRGVLLLPGGRLPLNIFEPRYLAMVRDALGAGRLLGIIQPQEAPSEHRSSEKPSLYEIGCAGRIVHFEETPDGRFLVTLLGLSRFRRLAAPCDDRPYLRCRVEWEAFSDDLRAVPSSPGLPERGGFIATACRYLGKQGMSFEPDAVAEAPLDRLATAIAMICPFSAEEKQALLEAADPATRAAMLLALMEMALYQSGYQSEEYGRKPQFN